MLAHERLVGILLGLEEAERIMEQELAAGQGLALKRRIQAARRQARDAATLAVFGP